MKNETTYDPKDVKKIKEMLDFLNSEHSNDPDTKLFKAFHPRGNLVEYGMLDMWHIFCSNYLIYASPNPENRDNFNLSKEACRAKYPKVRLVFVFLHDVTLAIKKHNQKGGILVK